MHDYKYKVKVTPGSGKRGKATKMAVQVGTKLQVFRKGNRADLYQSNRFDAEGARFVESGLAASGRWEKCAGYCEGMSITLKQSKDESLPGDGTTNAQNATTTKTT